MTLEERRIRWAEKKRIKRAALIRKLGVKAIIAAFIAACVAAAIFIFANKAEAKEEFPMYKYYTVIEVKPGDTLTSIAKEHLTGYSSVSEYVEEVRFANQLASADCIRSGQKLFIPYYSTEYKE